MSDPIDRLTVGSRVVVRVRLDPARAAEHGGHTMTDVLGELLAVGPATATVHSRDGDVVIDRSSVVVAKVVPPRPTRRGAPHRAIGIEDLERVMVGAWPPVETARLGDWVLRAAGGFTLRANSALALGSPGCPLGEAVDRVTAWYAVRGLPARLAVAGPVGVDLRGDPLAEEVLGRDWTSRVPTLTLTAAAAAVAAAAPPGPADQVVVTAEPDPAWLDAFARYRPAHGPVDAVLTGSPDQAFASRVDAGAVVGIARLGVADGWGGIGAMWVAPEHRRTGVARTLLAALAARARRSGVFSLHLQVDEDNTGARTAYERAGFETHHAYVTLTGPGQGV